MKKIISCIFFCFYTISSFSQVEIKTLTAKQVYDLIQQSNKPSFVAFWNPNCEVGEEVLLKYQSVINKYSQKINVYIIGLTDMHDLMVEMSNKVGLDYPLYSLGGDKSLNLFKRKQQFVQEISKLTNIESGDFIMMYSKGAGDFDFIDDTVEIDYDELNYLYNL